MSEKIQKRNSSKKTNKKTRKNISKSKNNQIEKVVYEKEINYEDEYAGLAAKKLPNEKQKPSYYGIKKSGDTNDFKTKWKTEICHYWEMNHYCKYGDNCAFAHGENELKNRKISFNYKTKPCKQVFEIGFCPYGSRCQFSHKKEFENNKNNKNSISYLNSISNFLKSEKISEELLKRPRLLTFENIFHSQIGEAKENRKLSMNYKTKLCKQFFETGYCPYGSRCQFSHKKEHVYINYINSISDFLKTEKINEDYIKRPRLVTFENIYKANFEETKNNRIKLFEDIKKIKKISEDSISTESNENNQNKNKNKRNRFMSV